MKSHVTSLLHISEGILRDVLLAYPQYRGVDRDIARLTLLCKDRGLSVFTLDLPALDTLLTRGLECGFLPPHGYRKVSKRVLVPRLFSGLWLKIFDERLCLRQKVDTSALAMLRQLLCIGKKLEIPCSAKRIWLAKKEYISVESRLPEPSLGWERDNLDPAGDGHRLHLCNRLVTSLPLFPEQSGDRLRQQALLQRCQQVADIVSGAIGPYCAFDYSEERIGRGLASGLKHGPGAVAERTGFVDKNKFESWSVKLETVFPYEFYGTMPSNREVRPLNRETPSRLIAVPKTAKGPRLIAAEPTEHQWCQQLTLNFLVSRIKGTFLSRSIDLKRQDLSARMAQSASLDRSSCTVDLSSASDRLTCFVVERMFRRNPELLKHLHSHRTRWISIDFKEGKTFLKLRKFASQGTAVTFPIQTIIFYIIAVAALMPDGNVTEEKVRKIGKQVRVYGDDIILPSTGYAEIVDILTMLDLKVNEEKSFVHGKFREACGMDAYDGDDVTPIKPRTTIPDGPASCQAVLDTCNNLFYKGYWNASELLKHRLDQSGINAFPIVGRGAVASGYGTFCRLSNLDDLLSASDQLRRARTTGRIAFRYGHRVRRKAFVFGDIVLRSRFNRGLQRDEVFATGFQSRSKKRSITEGYSSLFAFVNASRSDHVDSTPRVTSEKEERSVTRKSSRWVALSDLFGRGASL